jgi:hypothetical protein
MKHAGIQSGAQCAAWRALCSLSTLVQFTPQLRRLSLIYARIIVLICQYHQGFLHAFYNLAANLEYVEPLREEIESVLRTDGWTKAAMGKMVKLDSFLKESARYVPGSAGRLEQILYRIELTVLL